MTTNSSAPTPAPVCLTDGERLYYPMGAGRVACIGLADLAAADMTTGNADDGFAVHTAFGSVADLPASLAPVYPGNPPKSWTDPDCPLGFADDFADLHDAWLDWCDAREAAEDEAVAA